MKIYLLAVIMLFVSGMALAQTNVIPFQPSTTTAISVTTSASSATLLWPTTQGSTGIIQIMATNTGSQTAFLAFGGSAVAATTTSTPVPAGAIEVFSINQNQKYASAISSTSTTTLYLTVGSGN